ncbi:MAG TPA: hypothetical protein VFE15_15080 [Marmoricola sp.]|jgi:hypothetical protein|nr:hypothetical protein [Marmoricola sp.]
MSPDPASQRPSQVTLAGWAASIASGALLIQAFSLMAGLRSLDSRARIAKEIGTGSLKGMGFTVEGVIEAMRWSLFVSGAAAVAGAILGIYALQRHRGARIGLTVAAAVMVPASLVASSYLGIVVAVATGMLWTQQSRDWFAGRPITPPRARMQPPPRPLAPPRPLDQARPPVDLTRLPPPDAPPAAPAPPPGGGWLPPSADQLRPPPMPGWGAPPAPPNPYAGIPRAANPYASPYAAPAPAPSSDAVPVQIRIACVITWVLTAITALGAVAVLVVAIADSHTLLVDARKSPSWKSSFESDFVPAVVIGSSIVLVWSIAAAVLAVLAYRERLWAVAALSFSAVLATFASIVLLPYSVVHLLAAIAVLVLLFSRASRAWYLTRRPSGRSSAPGR